MANMNSGNFGNFGKDVVLKGFSSNGSPDSGFWVPKTVSKDLNMDPPTFSHQDIFNKPFSGSGMNIDDVLMKKQTNTFHEFNNLKLPSGVTITATQPKVTSFTTTSSIIKPSSST